MSRNNKTRQNCPHCNSEQELNYYQSVNVTLNPELKSKVLSGKLNDSICTNCHKEINIVSGFFYHDMSQKIMLELALADDDTVDHKEEDAKNQLRDKLIEQGYIYRKLKQYPRLTEKITILDQKLNDLVIEQVTHRMKSILDESIKEVGSIEGNFDFKVFFKKIESSLFKKKIVFHCFSHPSQIMEMKYDFKNLTSDEKNKLYNQDILRK
ncbi:hypothetical protein E6C50_06910 [Flavobacterium supellecticarium]|uniref:CpXC domain-containing protein n=1 Tax=Flavobacterium supellecticarium TaxID=2565924 RepID=A0A4S3ZZY9_9FLAO|nr:CpXC domain-containing protein [Flavobacterium supellecticarium]THF51487.1 hypothetical protein E6C50_06910 [Flavobacterium supellecticarium]